MCIQGQNLLASLVSNPTFIIFFLITRKINLWKNTATVSSHLLLEVCIFQVTNKSNLVNIMNYLVITL